MADIQRFNYINDPDDPEVTKNLPRLPCDITCECGHSAWWERFNEDALGFELPPNHFRCPGCGIRWVREKVAGRYLHSEPVTQCTIISETQLSLGVTTTKQPQL